ncbi:MAG: aldo/keto reductase [Candidatus Thiodiazotropha sp.]
MQKRKLGDCERELPAIGLGCTGLSEFYGLPLEQSIAVKLLHEAIELGVEHFDTAEMYGIGGANESLLGETIRRAAKIHPISSVQSEYSIFSRDIETYVIPACIEVGASLVAYSPLGRGMLTGRFKTETLDEGDWRLTTPRYQGDAYTANVALVSEIEAVASSKSCTPAQHSSFLENPIVKGCLHSPLKASQQSLETCSPSGLDHVAVWIPGAIRHSL